MTSLRLLFIYKSLSLGGVEAVILNRMRELNRREIEARAVFFKAYDESGLTDGLKGKLFISGDRDELYAYVKQFKPDWIVHFDTPDLVPVFHQFLPACKQAYEFHTTDPKNAQPLKSSELVMALRGIIVPSDFQLKAARRLVPDRGVKMEVVPNGLPAEFFQPTRTEKPAGPAVIAWVGRLESHKNWLSFLKIASQATKVAPSAIWLLGGQRATEQQQQVLWDFIRSNGLAPRFRWFPEVSPADMPGFYQAVAHSGGCLVSTSKNESFGLAILEALASGCPVVAPRVGALEEIVQDGENGFLYPPANWSKAALAVERIIQDRPLQQSLGESASRLSLPYALPEVVDRFLGALEALERGE